MPQAHGGGRPGVRALPTDHLGAGDVFTEWRWFNARQQGRALLGEVDKQTLSTNVGYSIQGHTFSGGYQKVSGDTAYAYSTHAVCVVFSPDACQA
ncbi:OprD family outer membrane porin [Pseudomonas monteilii]